MATPRILELAAIINTSVVSLQRVLSEKGLPSPSFGEYAPTSLPKEVVEAQDAVLDATAELHDLMLEPLNLLYRHGAHNNMASLQAIGRFKIANLVPEGGQASFSSLAEATGLDEAAIRRLLRHSMSMRVFCEPQLGMVAHTATSRILRETHMNEWMSTGSEEMWPAATKYIDALQKWPSSQEPNETAFALANNTTQSIYDIIGASPTRAMRFSGAMKAYTSSQEYAISHVLDNYPWSTLGPRASVIDIGGAQGHVGIELARKFDNLDIIVQDMEHIIANAADRVPENLRGKVRFVSHNFLEEQTINADVFFFRWVFHNWADSYGVRILRALIPTLRKGNKIVINDTCMPEPGTIPAWREKDLRSVDMNMHAIFNSHERDAEQWKHLFEEADKRFKWVGITQPKNSALAIIETEWIGSEEAYN